MLYKAIYLKLLKLLITIITIGLSFIKIEALINREL